MHWVAHAHMHTIVDDTVILVIYAWINKCELAKFKLNAIIQHNVIMHCIVIIHYWPFDDHYHVN